MILAVSPLSCGDILAYTIITYLNYKIKCFDNIDDAKSGVFLMPVLCMKEVYGIISENKP